MKFLNLLILLTLAVVGFGCEKEDAGLSITPDMAETFEMKPVTDAPFFSEYASLIGERFEDQENLQYHPGIDRLVYQGDIAYSENHLAYIKEMVEDEKPNILDEDPDKHRMYNRYGKWETINRFNTRNINVFVPPFPDDGSTTAAQRATIAAAVRAGIVAWNSATNCEVQITMVNGAPSAECVIVYEHMGSGIGLGEPPTGGNVGPQFTLDIDFLTSASTTRIINLATHEFGHNLGLAHTNAHFDSSDHICNSVEPGDNSTMAQGVGGRALNAGDRAALGLVYPDEVPHPTVSLTYVNTPFINRDLIRINSDVPGFTYSKMKILVKDLTTGNSVLHHLGCWRDDSYYRVPVTGRSYEVSVQSMNYRQDRGSGFGRSTIFVPN